MKLQLKRPVYNLTFYLLELCIAKLQMSMGRLYYLIGGRQTTMFFFLLFPNLDMVFRNSTPGEFRMYLTR